MRLRGTTRFFIGALAVLGGCASPNPALYTIAAEPGAVVAAAPKTIALRDVGLAGYLDRPGIVRSSDGYRLAVAGDAMWGEPLGAMIGRVLSIELAQRLPGSNVYNERGAIDASPDATVSVNIQHMDFGAGGELVLLAQAAVEFRRRETATRTFTISVPAASSAAGDEVAAISAALGRLADDLALMLRS